MARLQIYLQMPEIPGSDSLPFETKEECMGYLAHFCEVVEIALRERDADVLYDAHNVNQFFQDSSQLFEPEYFATPEMRLYAALATASNWQDNNSQDSSCTYVQWGIFDLSVSVLYNHTLAEIVERKLEETEQQFLFLMPSLGEIRRAHIPVFKDALHMTNLPKFVHIAVAKDSHSLSHWLANNRMARVFNLSPKHGENGAGHWPNASPLLCSRQQAQELLDTAIGDARISVELYNLDAEHQHYIVFKWEGDIPQNLYHGYHVPMESSEVPQRIKALLSANSNS